MNRKKYEVLETKQSLSAFDMGQLNALKWVKDEIQKDLAELQGINAGYILRETRKDALYALKITIKTEFWSHMLNQIREKIKTFEEE